MVVKLGGQPIQVPALHAEAHYSSLIRTRPVVRRRLPIAAIALNRAGDLTSYCGGSCIMPVSNDLAELAVGVVRGPSGRRRRCEWTQRSSKSRARTCPRLDSFQYRPLE